MLTRVRIEVEEETAEACVESMAKYEHAIQQQEARRYRRWWPISATLDTRPGGESHVNTPEDGYPTPDHDWDDPLAERDFYNEQLSREITEEVIEYDSSLPGYKGRRVVVFTRIDTRSSIFREVVALSLASTITHGVSESGTGPDY